MNNKVSYPELIVIDLNNTCNLRCKMCDVGVGNKEGLLYKSLCPDEALLTFDILKKFVDEVAPFKPEIQLGGPETLLYRDILKFIEYMVVKGLKVTLVTNGLLLPKYAEALASIPIDALHVSLDGPPHIHNNIRGNTQSFQNAYEGLKSIISYKEKNKQLKPLLNISYAIFNLNYYCLNEFLDYLNNLPLNGIWFRHMVYITKEMAEAHNELYGNYIKAAKTCILDGIVEPKLVDTNILWREIQSVLKRKDFTVGFSPGLYDKGGLEDYYYNPEKIIGNNHCLSPWQRARLKANGDIAIGHICFPLSMGNITKQSFEEIWNGTEFNKFRTFLSENGRTPACTRCCAIT